MPNDEGRKSTFLNRRDWSSYIVALQSAASYPSVMKAVSSGRAWFQEGATHASNWLGGTEPLKEKLSVG